MGTQVIPKHLTSTKPIGAVKIGGSTILSPQPAIGYKPSKEEESSEKGPKDSMLTWP